MTATEIIDKIKVLDDFDKRFSENFIAHIRCVDGDIHKIFFPSSKDTKSADFFTPYKDIITDYTTRLIFRVAAEVPENQLDAVINTKDSIQNDLDKWYGATHQTVGVAAASSCFKDYIPEAFTDPSATAAELYSALTDEATLTGLCVYDETDAKHRLTRLLWCLMRSLDASLCESLTAAWKASSCADKLSNVDRYAWMDILKAALNTDSSAFLELKKNVRDAVQKETLVSSEERSEVVDITPSGAPIVKRYVIKVYQQSQTVYQWMTAVAVGQGYLSGKKPDVHQRTAKEDAPAPCGCVLATTKILMASKKYKPITDIKVNDKICSADGSVSVCSGDVVKNGHVPILYSINNDEPFMSLDHPILTASGYKCADPKVALDLNPRLHIAQLKIGDVVMKYDGEKQVPVVVEKINYAENHSGLCADIHIADGQKSYITDSGYICYANYPEITASSIMPANSMLTEDFNHFLQENKEMLERTFGRHAYVYISELAQKGNGPIKMRTYQPDYSAIMSIDHADYKLFPDEPLGFESMSIVRGFAFFGSDETPVPLHVENGEVYWKTPEMSGYLKLYHDGFFGKGHVIRNGKISHFSAAASVKYNMRYSKEEDGEDKSGTEFGSFEMGFERVKNPDGSTRIVRIGRWTIPDHSKDVVISETGDYSKPLTYLIDKDNRQLCAQAEFPTGVLREQYKILAEAGLDQAKITFNTLFDKISGTGQAYDDKKGDYVDRATISGTMSDNNAERLAKLVSLVGDYLKNGMAAESDLSEEELQELKSRYSLSVEDLINLPVPDDMGEVHSQVFHRMLNMAVYAAYESNDRSKDLLGIAKPVVDDTAGDLTIEQADIAKKHTDFLVHKFIEAYLSYTYIKQGKSPDCKKELKEIVQPLLNIDKSLEKAYYYMNGNGEKCMPSQPDYSVVTNAVYHSVYLNNVIGLDAFYNGDRKNWARKMYDRLNQPETLTGLVIMQTLQPDNPQLTHYYSVLDVLDSSKQFPLVETSNGNDEKYSYATVLRKQVMDGALKSVLNKVKLPDASDKDAVEAFEKIICEFMRKYTKTIADGSFSSWDAATLKEMKDELYAMAEEYGYEDPEIMITNITEIVANIVSEILSMDDPDTFSRVTRFFKNHPNITCSLTIVFYLLGAGAIVMGFMKYGEMTPMEKVEFYTAIVDMAMVTISDISTVVAMRVIKSGMGDLVTADGTLIKNISKCDFVAAMSKSKNAAEVLRKLGVTGVSDVSKASEFWTQFARISTKLAKGLMILTLAVAIGVTGYQIYEDIRNGAGAGIVVLDSLEILADGIVLITEATSCLAASVCAAIPIIGVVAAAVGIVLAFVSLFVKRKPPETPIEKYIKNTLVGFVNTLEAPPSEWLKKHPLKDNEDTQLLIVCPQTERLCLA